MPFQKGNKINLGRKASLETKEKLKIARAKRVFTEETKQKISAALRGRAKSAEHRRRLSEANKGKIISYEQRKKISQALRGLYGSSHSSWKGGSLSYWKNAVKRRDGKCTKCGVDDPRVLTADHIKSKKMYPDLIFDVKNGVTLCHNCHAIKTFEDKEYRDWMSKNHWHRKHDKK